MAKAKPKPKKPKRLSYSAHVTKAKEVWRQSVLYMHQDEYGFCKCVTCGVRRAPNDPHMHCGHFIHARNNVYFMLLCVRPQCSRCNGYMKGRPREYASFIANHHGPKILAWLLEQSKIRHDFTRAFLDRIIEDSRTIIRQYGAKPCR